MSRVLLMCFGIVAMAGVLSLIYLHPAAMISPGKLVTAHQHLDNQCSACHVPVQGAAPARCVTCHAVARIGKAGSARPNTLLAFHTRPAAQACLTCHTDHQGRIMPAASKPEQFDHTAYFALTGPHDVACASCHGTPQNFQRYRCTDCHEHEPIRLQQNHAAEGIVMTTNCVSCHRGTKGKHDD